MENAADSLKMAAAVLVFIIAITSSFSIFGTAKRTADSIVGMRDKQAYLEVAELDTILYTSSSAIQGNTSSDITTENVAGITIKGDRIVGIEDVVSTIYRYNKEKYGVTIVKQDGTIIARFDSNTENIMRQYNNITSGLDEYKQKLEENTNTIYTKPNFSGKSLEKLYKIEVQGNSNIEYGAPWYGNDEQIRKRINADLSGEDYIYNGQTYKGKDIIDAIKGKKIIEVTNEIDQSTYLKEGEQTTNLLQQYQMPTVEVVYIII